MDQTAAELAERIARRQWHAPNWKCGVCGAAPGIRCDWTKHPIGEPHEETVPHWRDAAHAEGERYSEALNGANEDRRLAAWRNG